MPDAAFMALLDRYLAGECSGSEAESVRDWLSSNSGNRATLAEVERIRALAQNRPPATNSTEAWLRAVSELQLDTKARPSAPLGDDRAAAHRVAHVVPLRSTKANNWKWTAIAASLLIVAVSTIVFRSQHSPATAVAKFEARDFTTARGQRATIQLVDGSELTLGPASSARVAGDFGEKSRELTLVGEAHLTVHHDAAKPFRVHTSNGTVEDLGTDFVIEAYPESHTTQVVVASGKVALGGTALSRGQMGRLDKSGLVTVSSNVNLETYFGWTQGRLSFRDTPVREAFAQLGRWYDLDISLSDDKLESLPLTASFKNESRAEVLTVLDLALGLRHELSGRKVIFYSSRERSGTEASSTPDRRN
jgi:transmembrane sensor